MNQISFNLCKIIHKFLVHYSSCLSKARNVASVELGLMPSNLITSLMLHCWSLEVERAALYSSCFESSCWDGFCIFGLLIYINAEFTKRQAPKENSKCRIRLNRFS